MTSLDIINHLNHRAITYLVIIHNKWVAISYDNSPLPIRMKFSGKNTEKPEPWACKNSHCARRNRFLNTIRNIFKHTIVSIIRRKEIAYCKVFYVIIIKEKQYISSHCKVIKCLRIQLI